MSKYVTSDTGPCAIVPFWILREKIGNLAKVLFMRLCGYADFDTGSCYPSQKTLASELSCTWQGIHKAMDELVGIGVVAITRQFDQRGQTSNIYVIKRIKPVASLIGLDPPKPLYIPPSKPQFSAPPKPQYIQNVDHEERRPRRTKSPAAPGCIKPSKKAFPNFDEFWARYPRTRRYAKAACLTKWDRDDLEKDAGIIPGLHRWLNSADWEKNAGAFVPAPMVWLNQSRWEAHPDEFQPPEPDNGFQRATPEQILDVLPDHIDGLLPIAGLPQ